ncbi:MAG TPA: universal stress protein [Thermoplasmata archaeon]|nr:universal stress protein [Thermoplasmata archaeon]
MFLDDYCILVAIGMKILIAYDGSESAKKAIDVTLKFAKKEDGITLLTVIPAELLSSSFTKMLLPTINLDQIVKDGTFKERAEETLKEVAEKLEGKVANIETVVGTGDPADEILLTAKKNLCDLIVLGYKGFGKEGRFLIGSVTDKVVRHASTSVMVVR